MKEIEDLRFNTTQRITGDQMKQGSGVLVIPQQPMVAVSPSVPTPSPFSFSVVSTTWSSSRPMIHMFGHFLRVMVLLFSFASSLALATTISFKYGQFLYSFVVTTSALVYSLYQLFKGVSDIAHRGILISDKTSDYINFIFDLVASYLLASCSSVTFEAIFQLSNDTLKKAAIISFCMSVVAFLATAGCAIISGYKLSTRIMW